MVDSSFATVGAFLKQRLSSFALDTNVYEYGEIESYSDTIVQINGLSNSRYGELLEFEGGSYGLTLDLHLGGVGAALLGGKVSTSSVVRPTGPVVDIWSVKSFWGVLSTLLDARSTARLNAKSTVR